MILFLLASVVLTQEWTGLGRSYVARLHLQGIIQSNTEWRLMLQEIEKDSRILGVIIRINSPGGTLAGSEALFEDLRRLSQKKPVVSVLEEVAASGGYIAALATDHIVARSGTITGSIGVQVQWMDAESLMEKIGVASHSVSSGALKSALGPFEKPSAGVTDMVQGLVNDGLDWFVQLVITRRGLEEGRVRQLADGRIFLGSQALENNLVDSLGGEKEARLWMRTRNISKDAPTRDVKPSDYDFTILSGSAGWADFLLKSFLGETPKQTLGAGLYALWMPGL